MQKKIVLALVIRAITHYIITVSVKKGDLQMTLQEVLNNFESTADIQTFIVKSFDNSISRVDYDMNDYELVDVVRNEFAMGAVAVYSEDKQLIATQKKKHAIKHRKADQADFLACTPYSEVKKRVNSIPVTLKS